MSPKDQDSLNFLTASYGCVNNCQPMRLSRSGGCNFSTAFFKRRDVCLLPYPSFPLARILEWEVIVNHLGPQGHRQHSTDARMPEGSQVLKIQSCTYLSDRFSSLHLCLHRISKWQSAATTVVRGRLCLDYHLRKKCTSTVLTSPPSKILQWHLNLPHN